MTVVAVLLIGLGAALLVIAAWGVIRLPDALSRQHAATKAGTLALALVLLADIARSHPFVLIDCQVYTPHLASLGAREIDRDSFEDMLRQGVDRPMPALRAIERFPAVELVARS